LADQVAHDLEVSGFPRDDVRALVESRDMTVTGVMSFPRTDFEVDLGRDLKAIGASEEEAKAYVQGVRRGGVLVFATGSNEKADIAADIMNRHGAMEVEELIGRELNPGGMVGENAPLGHESRVQTGRIRQAGGGARMFVW
jgi:hypothetical protein